MQAAAVGAAAVDPEAERKQREAEEEARIAALRAHGTPVTPETFADWKVKFEAEMALQKAKLGDTQTVEKQGRLSGKQWFMQQEAQHIEVRKGGRGWG